jgi:hypothetical protein
VIRDPTNFDRDVLRRYPQPIAQLRAQHLRGRVIPLLGAGIGMSVGLPGWDDLVARVANHKDVNAASLVSNRRLPNLAGLLFQRYKENRGRSRDALDGPELRAGWRRVVHDCLYDGMADYDMARLRAAYEPLRPLVQRAPLVINYNFDDSLQRFLLEEREPAAREEERGFETTTEIGLPFKRTEGILYHPNGFIPRNNLEQVSDEFIFSDIGYADQLIDSMTGQLASIAHYMSKHTCLLLGLSLRDETLRHLLRQQARLNPGNVHYIVDYRSEAESDDVAETWAEEIWRANLETYNLVTLRLGTHGIDALGYWIAGLGQEFVPECDHAGARSHYVYYITGPDSVGKSSVIKHFNNLNTYDEYLDERPAILRRSTEEQPEADKQHGREWIRQQLRKRNDKLVRDTGQEAMVAMVERTALDPLRFIPEEEQPARAAEIADVVRSGRMGVQLAPGCVILLTGDPDVLRDRGRLRDKSEAWTEAGLHQERLEQLFRGLPIHVIDTARKPLPEVVRDVARIVYAAPYEAHLCDLDGRLTSYARRAPRR